MDWNLPDDQAVTIAGLVIDEAQTIPEPGQTFIFHDHRFQIVRRERNQVTVLRVSPRLETGDGEQVSFSPCRRRPIALLMPALRPP